ncbi:cytochrome P450 [Dentipellis sp. KUC8613]|nr:cytochrome P450 [Dentipellis sp. KUC8613]
MALIPIYSYSDALTLIASFVLCAFIVRYIRSPYRKVPAGPRGIPILGNIFQLREDMIPAFMKWQKIYGDICYVNLAGQPILVINSGRVAFDLLDCRSANYSERPRRIVAGEILCGGLFFAQNPYNAVTRRMRRASHEAMSNQASRKYHPMQTAEAVLLTLSLLDRPESYDRHLQRNAASLAMSMLYGHPPIMSENDPSVQEINGFIKQLSHYGRPGGHLVEVFPWMVYIPQSLAKWKREAMLGFRHYTKVFENLADDVAKRMSTETVRPCFTASLIENNSAGSCNLSKREIAWAAGGMFAAGSETTSSVMAWFLLVMIAFPEAQKRAQDELDAIVGRSRVPTFADFEHLPYIQAVVKESLRWRTTVPVGVPHRSLEDDWYEGMFIPKGTICIANVHCMNRDPRVFGPDAAEFKPERYLDATGAIKANSADDHYNFGFGRRVCPGRYLGSNTLFINMAVLLWAAKISRGKGDAGPLDLEGFVNMGTAIHPKPFTCDIQPRFTEVPHILSQEKEFLLP